MAEEIPEPERPICDPHHHLWDHPGRRYLLDELLADTGSGHNVVATVFVECMSMYRADGPVETAAGRRDRVRERRRRHERQRRLRAHTGRRRYRELRRPRRWASRVGARAGRASAPPAARFRGIRHAAGWDARRPDPQLAHESAARPASATRAFAGASPQLAPRGLTFDAWLYHPQLAGAHRPGRALSRTRTIILDHFGGPLGIGAVRRPVATEVFAAWKPRRSARWPTAPTWCVKLGGLGMPLNGFGSISASSRSAPIELAEATARLVSGTPSRVLRRRAACSRATSRWTR